MFWRPNRLRQVAITLLLLGSAGAAIANVLVVRSAGPSAKAYPAGRSLADNARITLQPNDTLVLLDARGTRTLRGPGTFTPGGAAKAAPSPALAALTGDRPARRARIGAVRGTSGPRRMPNVWHVDVSKSGPACVVDPANLTLWRADSGQAATLTVERAGTRREVAWAAGQATASWPAGLPLQEGGDYRLSWSGTGQPSVISVKRLTAKPVGLEASAAALLDNGCQAQLEYLIDAAAVAEG